MSANQRKLYDLIESRFVHDIMSLNERSLFNELSKARLIRLMQVASNPKLLEDPISQLDGFDFSSDFTEDASFFKDLKEICNETIPEKFVIAGKFISELISRQEKVIIWCCFTKSILGLSDYLSSMGIKSKILFGNTPIEKEGQTENQVEEETRESIIRDFHKTDSEFKVIIANSFAVSESISLHKACHNAIYFERTFNASHYIQSKDRIHRYGLKDDVITNYYYLVAENSIEETIHRRLIEKEQRLLEIIESMPIPLFNLIDDESSDLNEILKDYANRTKAL